MISFCLRPLDFRSAWHKARACTSSCWHARSVWNTRLQEFKY